MNIALRWGNLFNLSQLLCSLTKLTFGVTRVKRGRVFRCSCFNRGAG